jgi:glycosyltransferase involved in cell wall biosynthesis
MSMRIAHFCHRYPPALGGAEAYFARLSEYLAARGDEVTVFTTTALDLTAFWSPAGLTLPAGTQQERGVTIRRYPLWQLRGRRYLLKALSLLPLPRWQRLVLPCNPIALGMWRDAGRLDQRFDAVHATAFPYAWPIACALRLARRQGIPFFVTPFLHLGDPENPRDATRRAYTAPALLSLLRSADTVLVQTPSEQQALCERGLAPARVMLQGLGVDAEECTGGDRNCARCAWSIGGDTPLVGHLANNSVEKGTVDLLQAAARLWEQGLNFEVVLAGPEMPNFQRFLTTFPYRSRVRRLGRLSETGKRDFFAGLDVFALPSRSDSFGLVLLEAWANGLPNLAYKAGGVADLVRSERDGLLVRCGDTAGLAAALKRLLTDAAARTRLGKAGRDRLSVEFCWEDKLEQVRSLYQQFRQRQASNLEFCCVQRLGRQDASRESAASVNTGRR